MEASIHSHTKELARVTRHVLTVQKLIRRFSYRLLERADTHDLSKFANDELGGMIEIDAIADEKGLNSREYMGALSGPAIQLHRSRHSHHPEYHPNGIKDMSILDVIEMVCDWKAANILRGHPEWFESVGMMITRLDPPRTHTYLINLISRELDKE